MGHQQTDEALANAIAAAERLHRQGDLEEALAAYRHAVGAFLGEPEPQFRAALVLAQLGKLEEAEAALRAVLRLAERPPYLFALGDTLERMGRNAEAIGAWRRATALDPGFSRAYARQGVALMDSGSAREALLAFEQSSRLNPDDARGWWNLAVAAQALGEDGRAIEAFERYVALRPEDPAGWERLGFARLKPGFVVGARDAFLEASRRAPGSPQSWLGLAKSLTHLGEPRQAAEALGRAEALAPSDADRIASQRLVVMHYGTGFSMQEIYAAHREWALRYAPARRARPWANQPDAQKPLRIGYLSPRFHEASVASLIAPVLERHGPDCGEVYCYAEQTIDDAVTQRIRAACRGWRNTVGLSDEELASAIRDDGIDILVDLAGHTPGHRLPVLAHRPAPVQGTWLDYFNTTGLDAVDFLLSDLEHSPLDDQQRFAERLVLLPVLRYCWEPPAYAPPARPPPTLAGRPVVFGAFCRLAKLSRETLDAWCAILSSAPGSRLFVKSTALAGAAERRHLAARFAERGIDPGRLDLRGPSGHADMLAQYNEVDIALDTFPYNGGLTTFEALWMGRPVIALDGASLISRQSRAILAAAGLRELVARDVAGYVELATQLARDKQRLAALSGGLRDRLKACPALDVGRFVGALGEAYRREWQRWCQRAGAPP